MFGKLMYFDKKTIDEYKSFITGQRHLEIESCEVSKNKGATFGAKVLSAEAKASHNYSARAVESMLYECVEFEKMLANREDYFDLTKSADLDLLTIPRGSIIKLDAYLEIPEEFDIMRMMDTFKPILMNEIDSKEAERPAKEALKVYLQNAKATKIPVIVDADDILLCSKISQDNTVMEYEEFEELDEQVTILARVASGIVDAGNSYYDPLKDFMTMNRMMRRNMKNIDEHLTPLLVEREYRKIDVLAVYR